MLAGSSWMLSLPALPPWHVAMRPCASMHARVDTSLVWIGPHGRRTGALEKISDRDHRSPSGIRASDQQFPVIDRDPYYFLCISLLQSVCQAVRLHEHVEPLYMAMSSLLPAHSTVSTARAIV
jgi:hypothetical protein